MPFSLFIRVLPAECVSQGRLLVVKVERFPIKVRLFHKSVDFPPKGVFLGLFLKCSLFYLEKFYYFINKNKLTTLSAIGPSPNSMSLCGSSSCNLAFNSSLVSFTASGEAGNLKICFSFKTKINKVPSLIKLLEQLVGVMLKDLRRQIRFQNCVPQTDHRFWRQGVVSSERR